MLLPKQRVFRRRQPSSPHPPIASIFLPALKDSFPVAARRVNAIPLFVMPKRKCKLIRQTLSGVFCTFTPVLITIHCHTRFFRFRF